MTSTFATFVKAALVVAVGVSASAMLPENAAQRHHDAFALGVEESIRSAADAVARDVFGTVRTSDEPFNGRIEPRGNCSMSFTTCEKDGGFECKACIDFEAFWLCARSDVESTVAVAEASATTRVLKVAGKGYCGPNVTRHH